MAFGSKEPVVEDGEARRIKAEQAKAKANRQQELDRRTALAKVQAENDKRGALTHVKASR